MSISNNTQTFRQFCENKMSAARFNTIHVELGVSRNVLTRAFNKPNTMDKKLLEAFAKATNETTKFLIENFECGVDAMTAREVLTLI